MLLVHKAPSCLALQMFVHIRRPMDPTVLVGVRRELLGLACLADDCLHVQVVLDEDEDEADHDYEGGHLVVEFEEGAVNFRLVTSEPFHHFGYDRKLVNYCVWRHFTVVQLAKYDRTMAVDSVRLAECANTSALSLHMQQCVVKQ